VLFHVLDAATWAALGSDDPIVPSGPFLHLCTAAQLPGVLDRYHPGRADVVVLALDQSTLGPELRWEPGVDPRTGGPSAAGDDERFPHLYGPLPRAAVVEVRSPKDGRRLS
jgi:uncharacterized protein (DUF952 family)